MDQGRYDEAARLMSESLEIYVSVFGQDHLRTVAVAANLAAIHQGAGHYAEAVPLHRQNLVALTNILGPDHDRTLLTRLNLASSLGQIGQHEEAEALAREALDGFRATLGKDHALSLVALRGLAVIVDRRAVRSKPNRFSSRRWPAPGNTFRRATGSPVCSSVSMDAV